MRQVTGQEICPEILPNENAFRLIQEVHAWHPSLHKDSEVSRKQLAWIYYYLGMRVILDMLPTARKRQDLERNVFYHRELLRDAEDQFKGFCNPVITDVIDPDELQGGTRGGSN